MTTSGIGAKNYDVLQRFMLLGDSGVGKTCFMSCFANEPVSNTHISTIGIDFKLNTINVNGRRIKVQMWDTAGQERFHTLTVQYYRKAQAVLLVFDLTSEESFMNIRRWLHSVDQYAQVGTKRLIVGNKSDLISQRAVTTEEGQQLADEYGLQYVETSAIQNTNVDLAVKKLSLQLLGETDFEEGSDDEEKTENITIGSKKEEKKTCCS